MIASTTCWATRPSHVDGPTATPAAIDATHAWSWIRYASANQANQSGPMYVSTEPLRRRTARVGGAGEHVAVGAEHLDRHLVGEAGVVELEHRVGARLELAHGQHVAERVVGGAGAEGVHRRDLLAADEPGRVDVVHHRLADDLGERPAPCRCCCGGRRAARRSGPTSGSSAIELHVGRVVLAHEADLDAPRPDRRLGVDDAPGVVHRRGERLLAQHPQAGVHRPRSRGRRGSRRARRSRRRRARRRWRAPSGRSSPGSRARR